MPGDALWMFALVIAFAALVTAHVALVAGLAARRPRWRAAVALFAAPLAPYWGYRANMRGRAFVWVASLGAYAVVRVLVGRSA